MPTDDPTDPTTLGYDTEPDDIERLLVLVYGDEMEPDWSIRYKELTALQVRVAALESLIKRKRGQALAEGRASGLTMDEVADTVQLGTRQRVQQLIAAAQR